MTSRNTWRKTSAYWSRDYYFELRHKRWPPNPCNTERRGGGCFQGENTPCFEQQVKGKCSLFIFTLLLLTIVYSKLCFRVPCRRTASFSLSTVWCVFVPDKHPTTAWFMIFIFCWASTAICNLIKDEICPTRGQEQRERLVLGPSNFTGIALWLQMNCCLLSRDSFCLRRRFIRCWFLVFMARIDWSENVPVGVLYLCLSVRLSVCLYAHINSNWNV